MCAPERGAARRIQRSKSQTEIGVHRLRTSLERAGLARKQRLQGKQGIHRLHAMATALAVLTWIKSDRSVWNLAVSMRQLCKQGGAVAEFFYETAQPPDPTRAAQD